MISALVGGLARIAFTGLILVDIWLYLSTMIF
jgi:hypothetical protein